MAENGHFLVYLYCICIVFHFEAIKSYLFLRRGIYSGDSPPLIWKFSRYNCSSFQVVVLLYPICPALNYWSGFHVYLSNWLGMGGIFIDFIVDMCHHRVCFQLQPSSASPNPPTCLNARQSPERYELRDLRTNVQLRSSIYLSNESIKLS